MLECDICGRPSNGPSDLKTHKFSHMNDEERAAAEANGEIPDSCVGRRLGSKVVWPKAGNCGVKRKLGSVVFRHKCHVCAEEFASTLSLKNHLDLHFPQNVIFRKT